MRRRCIFLLRTTAEEQSLQVLLIEHVFFGDDLKCVASQRLVLLFLKGAGDAGWSRRAESL